MVAHRPGLPKCRRACNSGGCGKFDCDYYLAFRALLRGVGLSWLDTPLSFTGWTPCFRWHHIPRR
nr:MAG TPA: Seryl-tRNA synthetase [Caudoviricetes sp.]